MRLVFITFNMPLYNISCRYLSQHLYKTDNKHHMLDIFCQKELMGKEHSVEFVLRTRWRSKHLPLELEYRQRVDML